MDSQRSTSTSDTRTLETVFLVRGLGRRHSADYAGDSRLEVKTRSLAVGVVRV